MSRRQPKKPISKATAHLIAEQQRKRGVRNLKKRFLIVCEDSKSAPNYFRTLKKHLNLSATSIEIAGSQGGTQPLQVVQRAIEIRDNAALPRNQTEPFDEVWCVIDGDFGTAINNARTRANANNVNLAISTQCFEYWILLHFADVNTPTADCDDLVRALREEHLVSYDKGKQDFSAVVLRVDEACKRAKKLRDPMRRQIPNPENQNPCSEVYRLIEAIRES